MKNYAYIDGFNLYIVEIELSIRNRIINLKSFFYENKKNLIRYSILKLNNS